MKKGLAIVLAALLTLNLASCGGENKPSAPGDSKTSGTETLNESESSAANTTKTEQTTEVSTSAMTSAMTEDEAATGFEASGQMVATVQDVFTHEDSAVTLVLHAFQAPPYTFTWSSPDEALLAQIEKGKTYLFTYAWDEESENAAFNKEDKAFLDKLADWDVLNLLQDRLNLTAVEETEKLAPDAADVFQIKGYNPEPNLPKSDAKEFEHEEKFPAEVMAVYPGQVPEDGYALILYKGDEADGHPMRPFIVRLDDADEHPLTVGQSYTWEFEEDIEDMLSVVFYSRNLDWVNKLSFGQKKALFGKDVDIDVDIED